MTKKSKAARSTVSGIRARKPEEKNAVREQILRNAIELYRETGYQTFSMRKLAARAGFSPSSLYRYFKDKLKAADGDCLKEYIKSFAHAYLNFALAEPELYKLMTTDHPPKSVLFEESTTNRRWQVFAVLGDKAETFGLPALKSTVENSAATDAFWAFGHGLASLVISLPYFDETRMENTLAFVFSQIDVFADQLLHSFNKK